MESIIQLYNIYEINKHMLLTHLKHIFTDHKCLFCDLPRIYPTTKLYHTICEQKSVIGKELKLRMLLHSCYDCKKLKPSRIKGDKYCEKCLTIRNNRQINLEDERKYTIERVKRKHIQRLDRQQKVRDKLYGTFDPLFSRDIGDLIILYMYPQIEKANKYMIRQYEKKIERPILIENV
jgi:hypothetical protein